MKKIILVSIIGSFLSAMGHAGDMAVATESASSVPYLSLEGSYTWNQYDGLTLNGNPSSLSKEPFGGRLAVGVVRPYRHNLSLNVEFGGGYYGRTKVSIPASAWSNQHTIDGYDLLAGALYQINRIDIYGQVGAMIQNSHSKRAQNYAEEIPGGLVSGFTRSKYSTTEALPEIKAGGIYHLNDNWAISLAYMHVFGSSVEGAISLYAAWNAVTMNGDKDIENPALDSVMFGLRYNFA